MEAEISTSVWIGASSFPGAIESPVDSFRMRSLKKFLPLVEKGAAGRMRISAIKAVVVKNSGRFFQRGGMRIDSKLVWVLLRRTSETSARSSGRSSDFGFCSCSVAQMRESIHSGCFSSILAARFGSEGGRERMRKVMKRIDPKNAMRRIERVRNAVFSWVGSILLRSSAIRRIRIVRKPARREKAVQCRFWREARALPSLSLREVRIMFERLALEKLFGG